MSLSNTEFSNSVLQAYQTDTGDDPTEPTDTILERMSRVESIAETAWRVAQTCGVSLPPSMTAAFVARCFDDGTARLLVVLNDRVVSNHVWPTTGTLQQWGEILYTFSTDLITVSLESLRTSSSTVHVPKTLA